MRSLAQRQVAAELVRGLADPAGITAVTGEAGLGKSLTVASVIRDQGMTAWFVSPVLDDLGAKLALLYRAKSLGRLVLVIEDAQALPVPTLAGLFALLARERSALPRVVFVARPEFWLRFDDPALAGARDRIRTVAVLFPMDPAEAERFLCRGLGVSGLRPWAHGLLEQSGGNPRLLSRAIARHRPAAIGRPRFRVSSRALSGALSLLVLCLAIVVLTISMTEITAPVAVSSGSDPAGTGGGRDLSPTHAFRLRN